jgi:alkylation response protein AidB-like acyl-CoA dehydrogenase
MEFCLSEEQIMLQSSVNRYLDDKSPLDKVRASVEHNTIPDPTIWQGLADLGIAGLLIPEEYGGMGLALLDAMLVQEALGRHVTPASFVSTAVLGPLALMRCGSEEQRQRWLPAIAEGSLQVAVGLSEHTGAREKSGIQAQGGQLSGTALFVLGAKEAELVIVASDDGSLYALCSEDGEMERIALRSIDETQPFFELQLEDVSAELLPRGEEDAVAPLIDAGRVMLAADTLGASQKMLELAVDYAMERKQFNRVIGSFQAVKHLCAEMAAELEPCRSLVWYAAHAYDVMPEESRLMACHAKAHLAEVGRFVARTATEVHGGMGFTDLLGLHYWFKRIGFNRQVLGSPERVRDEAARAQGWI